MFNIVRRQNQNAPRTTASALNEWDPFRMMEALLRADPFTDGSAARTRELAFVPRFDVKESKDTFIFKADVPGVKEEDIDLSVTGNRLTVSGKRDVEEEKDGDNYYMAERTYGAFTRTFTLPDSADLDKIRAELKNGVLHIELPKRTESQPRRINLSSNLGKEARQPS